MRKGFCSYIERLGKEFLMHLNSEWYNENRSYDEQLGIIYKGRGIITQSGWTITVLCWRTYFLVF